MLGWRPRDLDLGHLPFARGLGIAQYTSDPVFARLTRETAAGPRRETPPPDAGGRAHAARDQPPPPRAASWTTCARPCRGPPSRRSCASTPTHAELGRHRDPAHAHPPPGGAQGRPAPRRRPARPRRRGGRRAGQQPRRTPGRRRQRQPRRPARRRRGGRRPRPGPARLRGAQRRRRRPRPRARRPRGLPGRPFAYGLALAGAAGVSQVVRDVLAELDLTSASPAPARWPTSLDVVERRSPPATGDARRGTVRRRGTPRAATRRHRPEWAPWTRRARSC